MGRRRPDRQCGQAPSIPCPDGCARNIALLAGIAGTLLLALAPGMPGGSGIQGQDVEGPDGVRGELHQWWESFEDPAEEPSMGIREWLDAAPGSVACRHRPSGNVRTTVHAGGRRSDAFELPDPSANDPEGRAGPDGIVLQVDVLTGDSYRTYRYANPGWRPSPRARRAAGIMELLQRVSSVILGR